MSTEARNPRSFGLDKMSALEIVRLMNEEEMAVFRALKETEEEIAVAIDRVAEAFQAGGRIIYAGSGTSGRIAQLDATEMVPTFGLSPDRFVTLLSGGPGANTRSVEDAEDDQAAAILDINALKLTNADVLIGLAASGSTPYVLSAVRHARQKGVWTCGIANNARSPLLEAAHHAILLKTGPEVLTGSTRLKAGTAQKLCLNRISTGAMVRSGKVIENLMVDVVAKNHKLKERCVRIVRELTTLTDEEATELLEIKEWRIRDVIAQHRRETSG